MSIPQSTLLAGRTALVTGAASGIGHAIAAHYLAAGATVVLADRAESVVGAARDLGAADGLVFDATDEQQVADTVAAATAVLGRIDILVTSHGILTQSPLVQMPLVQWQETLDIDLGSVFLLNRAVLPGMLAAGDGRIINVASQLGIKGGESLAHYAAAKAGVNAIAPGPIETPLLDGIDENWKTAKRAELPLGRFGTADEVAPTAVLLASNPGGNLFVGQVLGPNSGDVMP
jgi:3-oxoacyl-[acyl-carrier protein] reductase